MAKMDKWEQNKVLLSDGEPCRNVPRSTEEQRDRVLSIEGSSPFFKVLIEKS